MLANIEPSSFALSVISDDITKLTQIPGIGKKTAQRIVLELKDKLKLEDAFEEKEESYYQMIRKLLLQNTNLIKQRDLLLPRLMSGKLEV